MKYILNSPILTNWGSFDFSPVTIEAAREWVAEGDIQSAVGHTGTAALLSEILGRDTPANRISVKMNSGDEALIIRVLQRLQEGAVLSAEELRSVPFELGLLRMR
jgi:hypothetical protein